MFTLESATNPVFGNAEGTAIILQVKFVEFDEVLPFTATSYDPHNHGVEIYERAMTGEFGPVEPFNDPMIATEPQPVVEGAQTL